MQPVSFVIPVHEETVYLDECIRSILAQEGIDQFQIVIVLNAYEASMKWLLQFQADITIVKEKQKGASYARNCGIRHCKYEHIAFLDCDIVLKENWLKSTQQLLETSNQVACVQAKIVPHFREKSFLELYRAKTVRSITKGTFNYLYNPKVMPSLNTAAILCRKSSLEDVGGFSTDFKRLEDTDFTYKLMAAGYIIGVSLKTRAKVFNNHRSIYKYLKRSFVLGQYTYRLRRKWNLPINRLGALEFKSSDIRIKILHRLNYIVHRLGSFYEHIGSVTGAKVRALDFINASTKGKFAGPYNLNDGIYNLKDTVRMIVFTDRVHFMDFSTSKVMVFKSFPKVISHFLKGKNFKSMPLDIINFSFVSKKHEENENDKNHLPE